MRINEGLMQRRYVALAKCAFDGYYRNESRAIVLLEQLQASCEQKPATLRSSQGRLPTLRGAPSTQGFGFDELSAARMEVGALLS